MFEIKWTPVNQRTLGENPKITLFHQSNGKNQNENPINVYSLCQRRDLEKRQCPSSACLTDVHRRLIDLTVQIVTCGI
jgi:hypothetical protein